MFGFRKKEKNTVFLPEGTLPRARRRENAFASARAAEARMERARGDWQAFAVYNGRSELLRDSSSSPTEIGALVQPV